MATATLVLDFHSPCLPNSLNHLIIYYSPVRDSSDTTMISTLVQRANNCMETLTDKNDLKIVTKASKPQLLKLLRQQLDHRLNRNNVSTADSVI